VKNKLIIVILIFASILRLALLDKFPAGFNADEASIGYNAYSLIETGKDEHGVSWPLVFRSFDDYKPPVYFYLVLPFVKVLGLTVLAVRLPSALLGIASVLLLFLLTKRLFPDKIKSRLPELSALILAISPWHLQFSRGGWEVNVATFFILLAIFFFLKSLEKPKNLFFFGFFTVLSLYTYHSARIIAPVLFVSLAVIFFDKVKNLFSKANLKISLSALILSVIFTLPLLTQMFSNAGQSRFSGVSIFADKGPIWEAENYRNEHQGTGKWANIFHNKYFTYGMRFTHNYLSHFSPDFLFISGDTIARSKVPETGESLLCFLPFFLIGMFSVLKFDSKGKTIVLAWLLIAPLAASLTYQSPHALRAQNMSIPFSLITAIGLLEFFQFVRKYLHKFLILIVIIVVAISSYNFARYLNMYYVEYPKVLPFAWQYGFDQIAEYTKTNYDKYDRIIITDRFDQPYILIAFFTKYPPQSLQQDIVFSVPDKYGFSTGRKLGKYEFRMINYETDKKLPNTLLISAEEKVDDTRLINTVKSPSGEIMFKFTSTK
jgi:4-amino-4-deoxy-L-arabinose transferase-like glycosyltransferase